jgi:hypothetical protein
LAATLAWKRRERCSLRDGSRSTVCAPLKRPSWVLAALCLIAATTEIAGSNRENRRSNLGGFLFGGAIVTKVFALWGSVALLVLLLRRRRSPRALLAFAFWAAIPLLLWLAWSQSRFGFFLSPYSDPVIHARSLSWARPALRKAMDAKSFDGDRCLPAAPLRPDST